MKVLQVAVSTRGYRDRLENATRLEILSAILAEARQRRCAFALMPAGFLQARRVVDVLALRDEVIRRVAKVGEVGVVLGLDAGQVTKSTLHHVVKRGGLLPFWGLAVEPGGATHHFWQQKSFLSSNGTADNAIDVAERTVCFQGTNVLVLVCGEMFNHSMRTSLPGQGLGLVVDAGHDGLGCGLIPTLRALATSAGCPAMNSQHLAARTGGLHMVDADGTQQSLQVQRNMVVDVPGAPWLSAVERIV